MLKDVEKSVNWQPQARDKRSIARLVLKAVDFWLQFDGFGQEVEIFDVGRRKRWVKIHAAVGP